MKRKTSITKIASILTVLAMVWGGVACQPEAPVEPTKYTISFDSGVESITVEEGTVATEPTTAPEKTGYTFGGWLNDGAAYDWTQPVTSNLSLTAKWTAVEYTITYLPEGVETDNPPTYTIETETIVLDTNPTSPDAAKPKFVAWHVDSEEGAVVTEIANGSTGNKTFYAEFSAEESCVVKFMSGTTEVASTKVKKGTVATEPTTAPEKTGYTFGGWLNGEAAYDWTQPVTSNLSLTAKWTPTVYTITYLPEGVETDNPTTYTIETETFELKAPTKAPDATKPKFVAWYVDSEEGDVVTEIANGSTGNKTFYAEFSAEEPCVVKFMLGTEVVTSINVKKDTKITLPTDLEKYNLFSDADCTKAFDTNTAITEDTTIYVKLKTFIISYKVLPFDKVNPVEGKTNGSMPVEYGTVFTEEEINAFAEKIDGYTCKGIFTDEACTVLFDNTKAITSDLTVYVLYEEEPCVVKFMLGTEEVESTEVKKDTKITLPTGFEKYNLFSDADCTKAFDTNTAITEDTTIYVKLKTFIISYKVLPFDKVNPVEGETNGSMPVEYGKVFTDEEINAFAKEIGGYTYKGVFTDEACTVPFDNANAITSDLTVYVLYEEVAEEETLLEVDLSLGTMGWSYNATYDAESKTITLTGDYGQGSTGWNDGVNWSAYKSLNVDISEYSNDWGKIVIQDMTGDPIKELEFNTVSEVISMDLTDVDVSAVKQFSIQGKASGDTIVVDRVYFLQIPNVEVDLSLGTMGWSYNATYDAESKTITLTGDYGQGSTGWNDGVNWSAYKSLNVDISEYSNDWGKIVIQDMAGAPIKELEFNTVSEVISMDLTDVDVSAVKQFSIQGKASGDTIVVDRVYFITK